jgi:hypothetical protein
MLIKILLSLAAIVAVFIIVVALRPAEFRVARSVTIAAPTGVIFPHVNNLREWEVWSPWQKLDPAMKSTYEGPAAGVGAVSAWAGNNQVGIGRVTIVESRPGELIRFKLEMLKPFEATSAAEFTFRPAAGNQTVVTWSLSGRNNFIAKACSLFINCDEMVGTQFERGLNDLKTLTENTQKQNSATTPATSS